MSGQARFRINLAQREVEIEGSEAFVQGFAERLDDLLERLDAAGAASVSFAIEEPPLAAEPEAKPAPAAGGNGSSSSDLGPFGAFLHSLPASSTEVDKMLASGFFLQQQTTDQTFATGDANKRLSEHGIKIGNPSQCVRQSLMAKRVFMVNRGRYRVSQQGRTYLRQLMGNVIPA